MVVRFGLSKTMTLGRPDGTATVVEKGTDEYLWTPFYREIVMDNTLTVWDK